MSGNPLGGRITRIEVQKKSAQRVNLYLDDQYALALSTVVVERAALRPGLVLSSDDLVRLSREDSFQRALDTGLRYLSHRPRSEQELRRNLLRKGVALDLIDLAVERLKELGLLDDDAFAQFWVENRDRFNPRSNLALRHELFFKGVSRDRIDTAIADGDDDEQRALTLAKKRLPHLRQLDYRTFCQRICGLLARRGFSFETSRRVAREVWAKDHTPAQDEG